MREITVYLCGFCRRPHNYRKAAVCEAHEARCFYNPKTHSCGTCRHLIRGEKASCGAKKHGEPFTTACKSWKKEAGF